MLGGGDTAVDTALMLNPVCKQSHLIHRRDSLNSIENTGKKFF
ncbi:hypothetical protein [Bombilactobacillus bombi]